MVRGEIFLRLDSFFFLQQQQLHQNKEFLYAYFVANMRIQDKYYKFTHMKCTSKRMIIQIIYL